MSEVRIVARAARLKTVRVFGPLLLWGDDGDVLFLRPGQEADVQVPDLETLSLSSETVANGRGAKTDESQGEKP